MRTLQWYLRPENDGNNSSINAMDTRSDMKKKKKKKKSRLSYYYYYNEQILSKWIACVWLPLWYCLNIPV